VGQDRLGPSYFFISLVLDPLNSLFSYGTYLPKGIWSLAPIFLFLQEPIKDIIIFVLAETKNSPQTYSHWVPPVEF
jgi:hypothetical protein